jgi:hypothetical protein
MPAAASPDGSPPRNRSGAAAADTPDDPPPLRRGPWREDATIRRAGFRIHARPTAGYAAAVWWRNGRTYPHAAAMDVADAERRVMKGDGFE